MLLRCKRGFPLCAVSSGKKIRFQGFVAVSLQEGIQFELIVKVVVFAPLLDKSAAECVALVPSFRIDLPRQMLAEVLMHLQRLLRHEQLRLRLVLGSKRYPALAATQVVRWPKMARDHGAEIVDPMSALEQVGVLGHAVCPFRGSPRESGNLCQIKPL